MSVIIVVPRNPSQVPTPPAGYTTFFVDDSDNKGYIKDSNGIIAPLNDVSSSSVGDGVSLLGTVNDISTILAPVDGDKYLIGSAPIGILATNEKNIVVRDNGNWVIEQLPNNTMFNITIADLTIHYHNSGTFPTNVITRVTFDAKVAVHDIAIVQPTIEDAVNNSATNIQIDEHDVIYVKWDNAGIIKMYVWIGLRDGSIYGLGGTGTASSGDFFELPIGKDEYNSSVFRIFDNGDSTKKLLFDTSTIGTGQARKINMPNEDVDLGLVNKAVQTDGTAPFTQPQEGVNAVDPTDLVTLQQAQALLGGATSYFQEILLTDLDGLYVPTGTEKRYIVTHNLGLAQKEKFVFNLVDKLSSEAILADSVFAVDGNTVHVIFDGIFPTATDGVYITILAG